VVDFSRLRVVLVGTHNPLNIGAAARAMSNFGFSHLRVVHPYEAAFREARSAVGASSLLSTAEEYENLSDAVADCSLIVGTTTLRNRDLQHPFRLLPEGAGRMRDHLSHGNVALLFGSEKVGLSVDDLSRCHWLLRIPTREAHPSMNLGQAVSLCLYELVRDATVEPQPALSRPASGADVERIAGLLFQALQLSGYLGEDSGLSAEQKIRRLVLRLNLSAEDSQTWLGILRQIVWKCEQVKNV
jgi:tRNA/rRNA methyltransferase